MIDNYDSFTFNLVHYFKALGQEVAVHRNDHITLAEIEQLAPDIIVISPGPGKPNDAGLSLTIIQKFAGIIPILGVCLGHQCIAQHFGANIIQAKKLMHGKTSKIIHNNQGLFKALNNPLTVARYHSLIVELPSLPDELEISAWTLDAKGDFEEIMALQHKTLPIASVQFHPEAILTEQGKLLLKNYLDWFIS
jgi:anthranilate synthase/aminodeoxychorismate synthase-like glutamine amidotransferase